MFDIVVEKQTNKPQQQQRQQQQHQHKILQLIVTNFPTRWEKINFSPTHSLSF
jgi:hypothetical protein